MHTGTWWRVHFFFWAVGLMGMVGRLSAQPLSLEGAIDATFGQYPTLAAQRAALDAIRANQQVVRDNRLPNLRLHDQITVGTANGMSGSYFSLGLIVPTSGARREANQGNLATGNIALASADWEVYNFGRFDAEDQLARADVAVGEAGLERERFGLRQMVINTYLDLVFLRRYLTIEQQNLARVDTVRRIIGNLVRNGIRPGVDSSEANVELSRARLNYYRLQEQAQRARVQLATLTGRSVTGLTIDTTFRTEPLLSSLTAPTASLNHPLLRFRDNLVLRQRAELDLIRKTARPRLSLLGAAWARGSSLTVSNDFGPLGSGLVYSRSNFLLGVAATVNLTDFRRDNTRIRAGQFRVQEATQQLAAERIQLLNVQTTADSLLSVLRLELAELPTALRSAGDAYQQRLSLYNNGLESILGLTESLQRLSAVERQTVDTQSRAVQVRLQRAYATDDFEDFYRLFRP